MKECLDGLLQLHDLLKMGEIDYAFFRRSVYDIIGRLEDINTTLHAIRKSQNELKEEIDEGEHGRSTVDMTVAKLDNILAPLK